MVASASACASSVLKSGNNGTSGRIWDCRRAIEIAGGLPLAIRGDLFAEPGPDPVARWISETVLVTQLEVKQSRWVIGNIGFTRHGQEHLTKLARAIIAADERLYASQQLDESDL